MAHDAHSGVTCQACHLDGVAPLKDTETKAVRWEKTTKPGMITTIHDMPVSDDDTACVRCHFSGNQVGAASMILPPKSILCMPCHGATFSVGDTTTITTLLVFLVGVVLLSSLWLSGSVAGADSAGSIEKIATLSTNTVKTVFSAKSIQIIKALFFDVLLQKEAFPALRKTLGDPRFDFFPVCLSLCLGDGRPFYFHLAAGAVHCLVPAG